MNDASPSPRPALSRFVRAEEAQLLPLPAEFLPHFGLTPGAVALFRVEPFETNGLSLSLLGDLINEYLVPRLPPVALPREQIENWYQSDRASSFRSAAKALLELPCAPLGTDLKLAFPVEFPLRTGAEYLLELSSRKHYRRLLVHFHASAARDLRIAPADTLP